MLLKRGLKTQRSNIFLLLSYCGIYVLYMNTTYGEDESSFWKLNCVTKPQKLGGREWVVFRYFFKLQFRKHFPFLYLSSKSLYSKPSVEICNQFQKNPYKFISQISTQRLMNEQSLNQHSFLSILANEDDLQNSRTHLNNFRRGRYNSLAKQTSIITESHTKFSWNECGPFKVAPNDKLP